VKKPENAKNLFLETPKILKNVGKKLEKREKS